MRTRNMTLNPLTIPMTRCPRCLRISGLRIASSRNIEGDGKPYAHYRCEVCRWTWKVEEKHDGK